MEKWVQGSNYAGYIDDAGVFHIVEEYGGSDADFGQYDVEVQNGAGYYNDLGQFVRYSTDND